jgi:hypothetical protein
MSIATLNLAMTGNCQVASLIDANGTYVWTCMPRFDGDPVFSDLMAGSDQPGRHGRWAIEMLDLASSSQVYERNTAIVETTLTDSQGAVARAPASPVRTTSALPVATTICG